MKTRQNAETRRTQRFAEQDELLFPLRFSVFSASLRFSP